VTALLTCRSCSTWPLVFGIYSIAPPAPFPASPLVFGPSTRRCITLVHYAPRLCMAARVRPINMHAVYVARVRHGRSCSTWPLVFGPPLVTALDASTRYFRPLVTASCLINVARVDFMPMCVYPLCLQCNTDNAHRPDHRICHMRRLYHPSILRVPFRPTGEDDLPPYYVFHSRPHW
jgi:hypothetical protein